MHVQGPSAEARGVLEREGGCQVIRDVAVEAQPAEPAASQGHVDLVAQAPLGMEVPQVKADDVGLIW